MNPALAARMMCRNLVPKPRRFVTQRQARRGRPRRTSQGAIALGRHGPALVRDRVGRVVRVVRVECGRCQVLLRHVARLRAAVPVVGHRSGMLDARSLGTLQIQALGACYAPFNFLPYRLLAHPLDLLYKSHLSGKARSVIVLVNCTLSLVCLRFIAEMHVDRFPESAVTFASPHAPQKPPHRIF